MTTASDVMIRPGEAPEQALPTDVVRDLYRAMVRTRALDERLAKLMSEGAIGFHPTAIGNEAAVLGAAAALREGDWIFPSAHDFGAALWRGVPIAAYLQQVFGTSQDKLQGHAMPGAFSHRDYGLGSVSAPAATHLPHAVGFSWAARSRGEDVVSAAFFDGAEIDAADLHTGFNFAGVWKAPVLFFARVRDERRAGEHAIAYGIAHDECDGDDLIAVHRAARNALDRAVRGEGATVIDLRVGAQDPLRRTRALLEQLGSWGATDEQALLSETAAEIEAGVQDALRAGKPETASMFANVFAELPPHLVAQRDEARR